MKEQIDNFFAHNIVGAFTLEELEDMKALEIREKTLLDIEEKTWHLKSQPIWLDKGDNNTKFFQKFFLLAFFNTPFGIQAKDI